MNQWSKRVALFPLGCLALSGLVASGRLHAEDACPGIFKAAEVARRDFAAKIGGYPPENDFQRHAQNIENYDLGLSETRDAYVVVMQLRKGDFGVIKGGRAKYWIRKSDFSIAIFRGEE